MAQVRDYEDINTNLRYWFDRAFAAFDAPVFYDIGANDGVFTIGFAGRCSRVIAFEPARQSHTRLEERIAAARLANVTLLGIALSDERAMMPLFGYSDDTFNSLFARPEQQLSHYSIDSTSPEQVRVERLDDVVLANKLPLPNVVKIDIEGAELPALRGGEQTIRSGRPVILIEYSVDNTANAGYERSEIKLLLESWGYTVGGLRRNTDTSLYSGDALEDRAIWNLLCLPPGLSDLADG